MVETFSELVDALAPYNNFELLADRLRRAVRRDCDELRKLRIRNGFKRKEFACALNMEVHTLDKLERGVPLQMPIRQLIPVIKAYMKLERLRPCSGSPSTSPEG